MRAVACVVPGSLAEILAPPARVVAGGNSYDVREALKVHRYRWDAAGRIWHKTVLGAPAPKTAPMANNQERTAAPQGCAHTSMPRHEKPPPCASFCLNADFKPGPGRGVQA